MKEHEQKHWALGNWKLHPSGKGYVPVDENAKKVQQSILARKKMKEETNRLNMYGPTGGKE